MFKILTAIRFVLKVAKISFYKMIYMNCLFIPLPKSYLSLTLNILNGQFRVGTNVKNKKNLNVSINGGELTVGNNVFFNNNVSINCRNKISIGNDCLFGENVVLYDHDHEFKLKGLIREQGFSTSELKIGNNVWIGSNVAILSGTIIDDNVIIAAGSIVKGHVQSNRLYLQKRKTIFLDVE